LRGRPPDPEDVMQRLLRPMFATTLAIGCLAGLVSSAVAANEPAKPKPATPAVKKPSAQVKKTGEPALKKPAATEKKPPENTSPKSKPTEGNPAPKKPAPESGQKKGSAATKGSAPSDAAGSAVAVAAPAKPGTTPGFTNRIQPLLGKLGCNGRACHGSFQGQGGFRLSLFGSDPAFDHAALVDNGGKPRVDRQNPDASLILQKAMEKVDHGGGKRFDAGSRQHQMLRDWIAAGAPYDPGEVPVARIEVQPRQTVLTDGARRMPLRIVAHYADRTQEEVTWLAEFSTNDDVVAQVTQEGIVTAGEHGDTAVAAAFGGSVGTTQVIVPLAAAARRSFEFAANNRVDELVAAKWRLLGYEPSEPATDAEFLRRVSLDLIGTLPTADEVRTFLADADPHKRAKKIDGLLERPEYALYWATKFSDLTGNDSSVTPPPAGKTSWLWHGWLAEKLRTNRKVADERPLRPTGGRFRHRHHA
jgi:hypothetical protein